MPIVPVHLAEGGDDWEMIELQGELQAEGGILDGQEIGVLSVDPKGAATFRIGQHQLSGKLETLSEPFAVMRKVYDQAGDAMETEDEADAQLKVARLEIVAVIKRKIIFKNRPDTIVSDCFKGKSACV